MKKQKKRKKKDECGEQRKIVTCAAEGKNLVRKLGFPFVWP